VTVKNDSSSNINSGTDTEETGGSVRTVRAIQLTCAETRITWMLSILQKSSSVLGYRVTSSVPFPAAMLRVAAICRLASSMVKRERPCSDSLQNRTERRGDRGMRRKGSGRVGREM
jgi:hypothetical protein